MTFKHEVRKGRHDLGRIAIHVGADWPPTERIERCIIDL